MEKLIAVTGGIGSGKSTAMKIIEDMGYAVYSCDSIYANLRQDENFIKDLCSFLEIKPESDGKKIIFPKKTIADKAFRDSAFMKKLNGYTHGIIMDKMLNLARNTKGVVFCEVPLLYEGHFENLFDYIFVIMRNDESRFSSVVFRDGRSLEEVTNIANSQIDYTKLIKDTHTIIINNDTDLSALRKKVKCAIEKTEV